MSKEFTVFVVDASQYMGIADPNVTDSDFTRALGFVIDFFNQQLMRNRKSDRYCLVVYSGSMIKIIYDNTPLSLVQVKTYRSTMNEVHDNDTGEVHKYDLIDALLQGLDRFKVNSHYKFTRNICLITNGVLPMGKNKSISEYVNMVSNLNINLTFVLIDNEHNEYTQKSLQDLSRTFNNANLVSFNELMNAGPALRLIAPRCSTEGYLGFGELGNTSEIKNIIHLDIQVYPAIKVQSQVHGHEYYVDPKLKERSKIERSTYYYTRTKDDLDEEDDDEEGVEKGDILDRTIVPRAECTPGFKYSHRDILALTSELTEVATLPTSPSINILGFMKKNNFAYAYFTEEATYVIPQQNDSERNRLTFNSMVATMIELDYIALVRFVPKSDDEVQVCAAFPRKVALGNQIGEVLLLVRIAMKEDEKIGRFPDLSDTDDNSVDQLMESFILSKKLRDEHFVADTIDNPMAGLLNSAPTSEPPNKNTTLDNLLLSSNPATRRFNYYFRKILDKSLQEESLENFLEKDRFVERYFSVDEPHTLFNLDSILDTKEDLLYTADPKKADTITIELQKKLDVKYKTQHKLEKKSKPFIATSKPQPNDGKFGEYFDIEDILEN